MTWKFANRAHVPSRKIADRHYNRQKIGTDQFVPPGRCIVLYRNYMDKKPTIGLLSDGVTGRSKRGAYRFLAGAFAFFFVCGFGGMASMRRASSSNGISASVCFGRLVMDAV